MATHTLSETAETPKLEQLSDSAQLLLDGLSTQQANQSEFVNMLEMADFGATAEALSFAMLASLKEVDDIHTKLSDVVQLLIERARSLEVSHG